MTKEEFDNLEEDDYFYDERLKVEWIVRQRYDNRIECECTKSEESDKDDEDEKWEKGDNKMWSELDACYFTLGRYSGSYNQEPQSRMQEMTVADALKNGLQCGNIITVTCDFKVEKIEDDRAPVFVQDENNGISGWLTKSAMITFKPQPAPLYTPAHNELCTILTKNGLGTKAIAVHYNGKISAISIDKEGNADCHFKAEQIEKFLPFTE